MNRNSTSASARDLNTTRLSGEMWDKHLTELNHIWDLESLMESQAEHGEEPDTTRFHTELWDQHLLKLNQEWHVPSTLAIDPPGSLAGKLLFPLKKMVIRWIQPSIDKVFEQQNAYNAKIVQVCNSIVEAVNEEAVRKLKAQQDLNGKLAQTLNGLVKLVDTELETLRQEFRTTTWTYSARKEALEIEQMTLNRKLEQVLELLREIGARTSLSASSERAGCPRSNDGQDARVPKLPSSERQDDYSYLVFENRFRGDEMTIMQRFQHYVPYFQGCRNVLDLGCGRGEFLELLKERNINGYGVDVNQVMIESCRKKELRVHEEGALEHLQSLPDDSLDGIFSAQMVEHYAPKALQHLLQCCFEKLQSQKYLVIETQNPQSLFALSHFYRDLSHTKPVHPDALQFLLKSVGFQDIRIEYTAPFSPELMLQEIELSSLPDDTLREKLSVLNSNIRQLNEMLYGHLDYAIIARKTKIF